jgi:5-carboxymethyl-2-hydroxymuconate isomerase
MINRLAGLGNLVGHDRLFERDAVKQRAGDAILAAARTHLAPLFAQAPLGLTVQVDESPGQVYDGKHSTLHPLFNKA